MPRDCSATAHANGLDRYTRDGDDFAGLGDLVHVIAIYCSMSFLAVATFMYSLNECTFVGRKLWLP